MKKLSLILFSLLFSTHATANEPTLSAQDKKTCDEILTAFSAEKTTLLELGDTLNSADTSSVILDVRPFEELFSADPEKNLFKQAPQMLMSAPQRMLSMVLDSGVERRRIGYLGGRTVAYYPFFSDGLDVTNGARVVAQERAIEDIMSALYTQSRGDRSGAKIPLIWGPHGTGKSEIMDVFKTGAINLSSTNPKFFNYSFSFKNLNDIDDLKYLLITENPNARVHAPLDDSPLTLLPASVQKQVIAQNSEEVKKLIKDIDPSPILKPDPVSEKIVRLLYQHYMRKKGGPLTVKEQLGVLSHHVELRRIALGSASGNMPIIDVQSQDLDTASLFMAANPVVRALSQEGPSDIFAWYINGKIFKGHGNTILFDEYLRNPGEFRDMMLRAMQSRVMSVGGAPDVSFDSFIMAATNTANLVDISSDTKGKAAVDRMKKVPMRWSVVPNEIVKTMLYMNRNSIYAQELKPVAEGEATAEKPADWFLAAKGKNLDKVIPIEETLAVGNVVGSDYRYRVQYGQGKDSVYIAPHTLKFMAWVVSATRQEVNAAKASSKIQGELLSILHTQFFRDQVIRLKVYEGEQHIKPSELAALNRVADLLEQGDNGISTRDAGLWFAEVLQEARNMGGTATPAVAMSVLNRMLDNKQIEWGSDKEREMWRGLARKVRNDMLVPKLESDIYKALATQQRTVNAAYWEVLDMFQELDRDPQAKVYSSRRNGNSARPIDFDLINSVNQWFVKKDGFPLQIHGIAMYHSSKVGTPEVEKEHPDLLAAITAYYAQVSTRAVNIEELAKVATEGQGSAEAKDMLASLLKKLEDLGYNEDSARQALNVVKSVRAQSQQIRQ